ncbi:MAG: hypothetical protein U0694_08110 [Anaerolineae bacterium]
MSENKRYEVEWSFDFDKVADRIKGSVEGLVGEVEVKTEHYSAPLDGATAALVELGLSVGQTTIKAAEESANILDADVSFVGELDFSISGDSTRKVKLAQKPNFNSIGESIKRSIGFAVKGGGNDLKWDVRLTKEIPLELRLGGGVGPSSVDLTDLNLRGLTVDGGVGEMTLTLPATPDVYKVSLDGGVGRTHLTIAKGAMVNLTIDGGVGGIYITVQEDAHVNLKVQGGVGETKLEVPAEAGVSLNASGGLGNVSVPSRFQRIRTEDSFISHGGAWETANYASAENKITVEYEGGVGQLVVR